MVTPAKSSTRSAATAVVKTAAKDVAPVPAKTPRKAKASHHCNRPVTALLSLGGAARENQHGFVGTGVTARSPPSRRGHRRPGHASDRSGDGLLFPEAPQTGRSRLCRRAVGPAWHIGGSQARQFDQSQIHHPHGPVTTAGGCHPYPLSCRFVTAAGTDFPPFIPAIETVATRGRCRRPTPGARP